MTLRERVARTICTTDNVEGFYCSCPHPIDGWCLGGRALAQADAAIAIVLEEAAKRADDFSEATRAGAVIAAAIRALKDKTP